MQPLKDKDFDTLFFPEEWYYSTGHETTEREPR